MNPSVLALLVDWHFCLGDLMSQPTAEDLRSDRETLEGEDLEAWEAAQEAAKLLQTLGKEITPSRVGMAGAVVFLFIMLAFSGWYWLLPRDSVLLETHYMQRGGHLVMSEIHNDGSRDIIDVEIRVEFKTDDGDYLDHMEISISRISAHSSIAGDELEMMIIGHTVWDDYQLVVSLSYTDYSGQLREINQQSHPVGEWSQEIFMDKAPRHYWPIN